MNGHSGQSSLETVAGFKEVGRIFKREEELHPESSWRELIKTKVNHDRVDGG